MRVGAKVRILYIPNRAGTLCVRQVILVAEPERIRQQELIRMMTEAI